MPRSAAAKPGTERYRDERRKGGGPRMHARGWHDHDEPHELERVSDNEGADAVLEAESGRDSFGMGRRHSESSTSQGGERRKRTVPPSKGRSKAKSGIKSKASSSSGTRKKAAARGPRRIS